MMRPEDGDLMRRLAHVLWIGGASDAGKSTVARLLAEHHRWQIYPCDFHEHNHFIARADPDRQPTMFGEMQKSLDERWVHPIPEDMFRSVLATNDERFPMILADLRAMPARPMILVEGPRLFPKLVAPLLTDPHQAVWLMPTEDFARRSIAARDKPHGRFASSDPERFRHNFLRRDTLLAEYIRREATRLGLPLIEVDGSRSAEEMATLIEAHFAPYLASRQGS
jgi:hypothetical protein